MCFVDFASAFDPVDKDSLWRIMAAGGIHPKLLRLIKAYYSSTKMKVRASGSDSLPFEIHSGVRQGCALSPTLFNYIIDWILRQALQDYPGVPVGATVHVSDLAYADDIVILSSSYSEMQDQGQQSSLMSSAKPSCLTVSHLRMWKNSSTLARAPRRSEAGLIFLVPHSLAYNPVYGRGLKYRCAQRAGSTRQ